MPRRARALPRALLPRLPSRSGLCPGLGGSFRGGRPACGELEVEIATSELEVEIATSELGVEIATSEPATSSAVSETVREEDVAEAVASSHVPSEFHNRQVPSTERRSAVLGTAPSLIAAGPCASRRELGSISISTWQIRLRSELGTSARCGVRASDATEYT
jgi:hypothetical protein